MYVLIFVLMSGSSGLDASKDIFIPNLVNVFETEEECHDRLRILHKEAEGSSLKWEKNDGTATNDILFLLTKNKYGIWKCVEANTTIQP